ncbi:KCNH6 [Symbiodinium pilosum]|uniref:KCNH6 protein n=1 Tax=Symbiodinium pilosum TaxID=2952 RepID=A0A812XVX4_SYMPI|nr:KCNH6 [Symbiodinium pilosum]
MKAEEGIRDVKIDPNSKEALDLPSEIETADRHSSSRNNFDFIVSYTSVPSFRQDHSPHGCLSWLVIVEDSYIRRGWNVVVLFLLLYTATYFPFQLCFIDLRVPIEHVIVEEFFDRPIDFAVNCLFYLDLVLNFFISYRDAKGIEVVDLRKTSWYYFRTYFLPNLVACIPPQLIEAMFQQDVRADILEVARFSRLQRISRLARLVRLVHLSKLLRFMDDSPVMMQLRNLRGVRIINLFCTLSWVAHMVGCGWYLCAALNGSDQLENTWLGMRVIDAKGATLLYKSDGSRQDPEVQWLNAFYFVLTVFTTVGFGDMSAYTQAEIGYVCGTMLLGAIVNSIILNEVIGTLTRLDESASRVMQQIQVVQDFSEHCNLSRTLRKQLVKWARETRAEKHDWDRAWMRELLTNGVMPGYLVRQLPAALFAGKLLKNRFVTVCRPHFNDVLPPRFHMILALNLDVQDFDYQQIVYYCYDQAFGLYLVARGIFAGVAMPSPTGGHLEKVDWLKALEDELKRKHRERLKAQTAEFIRKRIEEKDALVQRQLERLSPYQLFCEGTYFGDVEVLSRFSTQQRHATVRCESEHGGSLLQLHKDKLHQLMLDFPHCQRAWHLESTRHEVRRQAKIKLLTKHLDLYELATLEIQRAVVAVWKRRKKFKESQAKPHRKQPSSSELVSAACDLETLEGVEQIALLGKEVQDVKGQMHDMSRQVGELHLAVAQIQDSLTTIASVLRENHHAAKASTPPPAAPPPGMEVSHV